VQFNNYHTSCEQYFSFYILKNLFLFLYYLRKSGVSYLYEFLKYLLNFTLLRIIFVKTKNMYKCKMLITKKATFYGIYKNIFLLFRASVHITFKEYSIRFALYYNSVNYLICSFIILISEICLPRIFSYCVSFVKISWYIILRI